MYARVRLPDALAGLIRTELERVIYEAALSRDDTLIATRYVIEKTPQIDIAAELGWERKSISRRVPQIMDTLVKISNRLYEKAGA